MVTEGEREYHRNESRLKTLRDQQYYRAEGKRALAKLEEAQAELQQRHAELQQCAIRSDVRLIHLCQHMLGQPSTPEEQLLALPPTKLEQLAQQLVAETHAYYSRLPDPRLARATKQD
jgi:hypothetical protein